jgi:nucleotide-binding universal stress UspA family protein
MITISHILCPVDFSEFSRRAVDHAVAMARWYEARLTVLHVSTTSGEPDRPALQLTDVERDRLMADMKAFVGPTGPDIPVDAVVLEASDIRHEILRQTSALQADLLVMGSHGRTGFERLLLGSVTERVIRKSACPVMVVPRAAHDADPARPVHFHRILCPVDFSEGSLNALAYAFSIAQEVDAELTLLHAIEVPPELAEHPISPTIDVNALRASIEAARLQHLRELVPESVKMYCTVHTTVREGAAFREILKMAAERSVDLIVMGVQGRGAVDLMIFGSNTLRVCRAATCPVLSVPELATG